MESTPDTLPEIWEASRADLMKLALSLRMNRTDAEDVLQEVSLTLWRETQKQTLSDEEWRRWLYRVTLNQCRLEYRKRGRWRRLLTACADFFQPRPNTKHTIAGHSIRREEALLMRKTLETLDFDLKTPLVMRYYLNLDSTEIGEILEIPDSTVRSRLSAARKLLAERLLAAGYVAED